MGRVQRFVYILLSIIVLIGIGSGSAHAGDEISMHVLNDHQSLRPGDSGVLRVDLQMKEDWHTYWPGKSDSGFGLKLEIESDHRVRWGETIWPAPKRYLQSGDILDHIYDEQVSILIPYTINPDLKKDELGKVDVQVFLDALVCKSMCVPRDLDSSIEISISDPEIEPVLTEHALGIHDLYLGRAQPIDPDSDILSYEWIDHGVQLRVPGARSLAFYPHNECSELIDPINDPISDHEIMNLKLKDVQKNSTKRILSGRLVVQYIDEGIHHGSIKEYSIDLVE